MAPARPRADGLPCFVSKWKKVYHGGERRRCQCRLCSRRRARECVSGKLQRTIVPTGKRYVGSVRPRERESVAKAILTASHPRLATNSRRPSAILLRVRRRTGRTERPKTGILCPSTGANELLQGERSRIDQHQPKKKKTPLKSCSEVF
jgi:hypothetical protein